MTIGNTMTFVNDNDATCSPRPGSPRESCFSISWNLPIRLVKDLLFMTAGGELS